MGTEEKPNFGINDRRKLKEIADEVGNLVDSVDALEGYSFDFSAIEIVLSYILLQLILMQSNGEADPDRVARLVATTKSQIKAMVEPDEDVDFGFAVHYADRLISRTTAKLERDFQRSPHRPLRHNG